MFSYPRRAAGIARPSVFSVPVCALLCALLSALTPGTSAWAQTSGDPGSAPPPDRAPMAGPSSGPQPPAGPPHGDPRFGGPGPESLMFMSSELGLPGRVVKGAPYTAEAVSETVQTLADGNRITRKRTITMYRDGDGRTRQQSEVPRPVAYLNDVVAGKSYILNTEDKVATLLPQHRFDGPAAAQRKSGVSSYWQSMRDFTRNMVNKVRGDKPAPPADAAAAGDGKSADGRETRVTTVRINDAVVVPGPGGPGAGGPGGPSGPMSMLLREPRGQGVNTALGSKDFDGIRAEGTRTVWTIEAGKIGNDKPITITAERWYAPDLMLVVFAKDSDPRMGETTYRLQNLKRGDPSADLFRIPSGYTLNDPLTEMERQSR